MYKNFVVLFLIFWICISESFQAPLQVNPISLNDLYVCNQYQFEFKLTETLVHAKFELAYRESSLDWVPIDMNSNGISKDTIVFSVLDKDGNSNIELKYRFENNGILVENGTMPMPAFPQSVYDEKADKNCLSVVFKENTREPINDPLLLAKQIQSSSWENNNKQIATFLNLLNAASIIREVDSATFYNAYHNVSLPMCSFKNGLMVSMVNVLENHYRERKDIPYILFNQTMQAIQTQCLSNQNQQMMTSLIHAHTLLSYTKSNFRIILYLIRKFPQLALKIPKYDDLTIKSVFGGSLNAVSFKYYLFRDYKIPIDIFNSVTMGNEYMVLVPSIDSEDTFINSYVEMTLYKPSHSAIISGSCLLYDNPDSYTNDTKLCWAKYNSKAPFSCNCKLPYHTNSTERFNLYNNGLSLDVDPFFIVGELTTKYVSDMDDYFDNLWVLIVIGISVFVISTILILIIVSIMVLLSITVGSLCCPIKPPNHSRRASRRRRPSQNPIHYQPQQNYQHQPPQDPPPPFQQTQVDYKHQV